MCVIVREAGINIEPRGERALIPGRVVKIRSTVVRVLMDLSLELVEVESLWTEGCAPAYVCLCFKGHSLDPIISIVGLSGRHIPSNLLSASPVA